MTAPVRPLAAGEHTQTTAAATSSGSSRRPIGWCWTNSSTLANPYTAVDAESIAVNFSGLVYDDATFIKIDLVFDEAS